MRSGLGKPQSKVDSCLGYSWVHGRWTHVQEPGCDIVNGFLLLQPHLCWQLGRGVQGFVDVVGRGGASHGGTLCSMHG